MKQSAYPFSFVGSYAREDDTFQTGTLLYRFNSAKSGHEYEVHVESYIGHLYCLKFYVHDGSGASGKFSHTTGTYEPRNIFHTIVEIAADVLSRDDMASFLFIGAADSRDSSGWNTRRYRVYCSFLRYLDVSQQFETVCIDRYSMCILVNKKAGASKMTLIKNILDFIE